MTGKESPDEVFNIEKTWCGRYVLIVGNYLYLDTVGTMGVYYGKRTISSSLNVLRLYHKLELSFPDIKHGQMPDFQLIPLTQYKDIDKLLPSQILNIHNLSPVYRPILPDGIFECADRKSVV